MRQWLALGLCWMSSLMGEQADAIFFGGDIITVNDKQPEVEAVAIKDGKIVFVGDKNAALMMNGDRTELVDLHGKTMMPGFINPHTHIMIDALIEASTDVSAFKYKTIAEVTKVLKDVAKNGSVLAFGYDPSLMTDPGQLNFETLDAISTEVPIVVINKSGHIAYGNHKAFEIAHITDETPNPMGGSYQRDLQGHLTGVGYEVPAVGRLVASVNKTAPDQYPKMARNAMKVFADAGYTTITDLALGLPIPTQEEHIKIMRDVSNAQDAIVRMQGYVVTNFVDKIAELRKQDTDMFRVLGVKIWADGSIQGYTAAMKADYMNSKTKGTLNYSQDQLTDLVLNARKQGFQVAIHANGDQAIEDVLVAFEKAQKVYPSSDPRFRIEHASIVDPNQWKRVANIKATPSFTEHHVYYWGDVFQDKILGEPRVDWLDAAKSAKDLGLKFSFNDDTLAPANPLLFIQVAATRITDEGTVLNPKERISIDDAIKGVTLYPAWQSCRENEMGSIEVGKFADFVLLEQNPKKTDVNKIKDIKVAGRWLNGKKS